MQYCLGLCCITEPRQYPYLRLAKICFFPSLPVVLLRTLFASPWCRWSSSKTRRATCAAHACCSSEQVGPDFCSGGDPCCSACRSHLQKILADLNFLFIGSSSVLL